MEKNNLIKIIFFLGITVFILAACGGETSSVPIITESPLAITNTPISTSVTPTISPTKPVSRPGKTPTPTLNSIQQTQLAIYNTERAVSNQLWDDKATKVAQFPDTCDFHSNNAKTNSSVISPDGTWIASGCDDQTLIIQNREGIRWVLHFINYLSLDTPAGMPGGVSPKFWSPDGKYLYFTTDLGYSGGGNECFPGFGDYGLFRLNLKTGSWVTLISPTDSFPGYEIKFSPTGRRYATDINGVMITDLNTGQVVTIDVPDGIQDLSWSPDGKYLAYSVAGCGEQFVQSSSVYVWNASTNQTQKLFTTDGILLRPESWIDNSTLRISGEKYDDSVSNYIYTIYVYNISQHGLVFTGTATPYR